MSKTVSVQQYLVEQQKWLRSVLVARVFDPNVVDDLMSEVTQDALALGDRWTDIQYPGPWLYRVAVRKVLQYRRRLRRTQKNDQRYLNDPAHQAGAFESVTPLENLERQEFQELVKQAMNQLNGRDREILLLKYVHEWNYDKISAVLGLDKSKIAYRLRNARERLRGLLNYLVGHE